MTGKQSCEETEALSQSEYIYLVAIFPGFMGCAQCGKSDAALTKVEYKVEEGETIPLCADCRDEFKDGGLVKAVSLVDQ